MTLNFYLVVNHNGSVRTLKSKPNLDWNEISMKVKLEIPNALFQRPQFEATLTIPDTAIAAHNVPVELTDTLQEVIQQSTGYDVRVTLVPQEGGGA